MPTNLAPIPIRWWNLPWWAFQTARADRQTYRAHDRPLTVGRMWRSAMPKLDKSIFILAAPRSGSTFLGSCLAALPEVSYHFEPVATKAAARCVAAHQWSFRKARRFYRGVYRWLLRMHLDGDLRLAEKTPQNAFLIPFLHEAFPRSQFVHLVRDGRDAALSYSRQPWLQESSKGSGRREPGGYLWGPYARFWVEAERVAEFETTSDLHRCIWAWRRHTEEILTLTEPMIHRRFLEVRYEDLARFPLREAERLLDFLQIKSPASRKRFVEAAAQVRTDSVGRWQQELSGAELAVIDKEAGALLRGLGYMNKDPEPAR